MAYVRLAALVVVMLGATSNATAQVTSSVPVRKAAPLDSVGLAEKAALMTELRQLREKSPGEYEQLRAIYALMTHLFLGRLGYIAGPFDAMHTPELADAIRSYERDRGLPVTGDPMHFEVLLNLRMDAAALDDHPHLPSRRVSATNDVVTARGSWVFPEMGDQLVAVELSCDRSELRCFESQAILSRERRNGPALTANLQMWRIASWDTVEIITHPVDLMCARYRLHVNLVQGRATKVRSKISNAAGCAHQESGDLVIHLEDGGFVSSENARISAEQPFPARLTPRASAILNSTANNKLR